MYRSCDEEVFLAPESIVAGVVASAAFDDELELPDPGPFGSVREVQFDGGDSDADAADADVDSDAADADVDSDAVDVARQVDETSSFRAEAERIDRWARRMLASNGFGG